MRDWINTWDWAQIEHVSLILIIFYIFIDSTWNHTVDKRLKELEKKKWIN